MGKLLESLGVVDGYDIVSIGAVKAKNDELFTEILKVDKKVQEEAVEVLKNGKGFVYAIMKEKKIYGLYLFESIIKEESRELKHVKTVYSKEVPKEVHEKYDEQIEHFAKDFVTTLEFDKVTLEDKVVQIDPAKEGNGKYFAMICGYLCGFTLGWIVFDDILWGFLYGMIFMPLFSEVNVIEI